MPAPSVRIVRTTNGGNPAGITLNTPGSEVTLLTGGTGLKDPTGASSGYGGNVVSMFYKNTNTTTARRVKGYVTASGDTLDDTTLVLDEWIPPNGTLLWQPRVPVKYKDSATVKASQDTGTDVYGQAEAVEFY